MTGYAYSCAYNEYFVWEGIAPHDESSFPCSLFSASKGMVRFLRTTFPDGWVASGGAPVDRVRMLMEED